MSNKPLVPLKNFDFSILDSADFKEDAVREEIIYPILNAFGYSPSGSNKIIRSKNLEHPFLTVGSKRKPITLIPDYLLKVGKNFTCVLDAKAPSEEIKTGHNVEQVYSYAVHPEIRVNFFGLCNGKEFILFELPQKQPVLYFHVSELESHWDSVLEYLSPDRAIPSFVSRLIVPSSNSTNNFNYTQILNISRSLLLLAVFRIRIVV
jgi:Type I restriction enzyme R protein N terminus (HSDR_N)